MHPTKVIVFDIDGTLANIEHRREHVMNGRRNWKSFNAKMVDDTPFEDMNWLVNLFATDPAVVMVLASGRGEEDREKTQDWIRGFVSNWVSPATKNPPGRVVFEKLYMRPARDNRKDSIIKKEILDQIVADYGVKPFMVFDDRNQVVNMWRENGVRCLQVAPGDF
jgi:hypothetical protein